MNIIISNLLIFVSLGFMIFGIIGIFRFKDFYARILISSKVETVGFLTIMVGLMFRTGISYSTMKIMLICLLAIITNPLSTHAIARSAYLSGYKTGKEN
ncbi:monovalent cation/H(+) antiporter subunit G [Alkalibacter mobilis]|uniref:monovalent cation/H(+) antiporter subunit G n=1 Tax=Alkalibacter mobilis TaxID=2787712 RepID=UPI00189D6BDF|nr:monovalent cation/H(+) antiporter subunit G [Alkalibacter mobilis]MBF7097080.1 monovalent cation/H(+) antiporter subunit G [Alkalibacter mobilis]